MNRIKVCICIIIVAIMLFGISNKYYIAEYGDNNIELSEIEKLQQNAVAAGRVLSDKFPYDENGCSIYPDEFAGMHIEGDKLVVSLIDLSDEIVLNYTNWLGEYAEYTSFEKAEYSYNYLKELTNDLVEDIKENTDINFIRYGISQTDNKIVLGVGSEDYAKLQNQINKTRITMPVSLVEVGGSLTTSTDLLGGMEIANVDSGQAFTLACCGIYRQGIEETECIATCGHGNQSVGDTIQTIDGREIGKVVYNRFSNGSWGDFEFVKVNETMWTQTYGIRVNEYSATFTYPITKVDNKVKEGTVVRSYGNSDNRIKTSAAVILSHDETIFFRNTNTTINGLIIAELLRDDVIENGDSGGPVYYFDEDNDGGIVFCGIISGTGSEVVDGIEVRELYFTPNIHLHNAGFTPHKLIIKSDCT